MATVFVTQQPCGPQAGTYRRDPRRSFEAVKCATLESVHGCHHCRLPETIGNFPPAAAKRRCYAMTSTSVTCPPHSSIGYQTPAAYAAGLNGTG
jgi:hypothetical protein